MGRQSVETDFRLRRTNTITRCGCWTITTSPKGAGTGSKGEEGREGSDTDGGGRTRKCVIGVIGVCLPSPRPYYVGHGKRTAARGGGQTGGRAEGQGYRRTPGKGNTDTAVETLIWRVVVVLGVVPKNLICRSRYGVSPVILRLVSSGSLGRLHCALLCLVQAETVVVL